MPPGRRRCGRPELGKRNDALHGRGPSAAETIREPRVAAGRPFFIQKSCSLSKLANAPARGQPTLGIVSSGRSSCRSKCSLAPSTSTRRTAQRLPVREPRRREAPFHPAPHRRAHGPRRSAARRIGRRPGRVTCPAAARPAAHHANSAAFDGAEDEVVRRAVKGKPLAEGCRDGGRCASPRQSQAARGSCLGRRRTPRSRR